METKKVGEGRVVKTLSDFYQSQLPVEPFHWLRGRSFSEAFVICIGAGPWKFGRRKKIQGEALNKLAGRDISEVMMDEAKDFYPLAWQNNFILETSKSMRDIGLSFNAFCEDIKNKPQTLQLIKNISKSKGNPKVISLFCRDALQAPSFPIDRHVKRKLIELGLPANEDKMIKVCSDAGIDPRSAAVAFVRAASDMDNPDWSIK